jgi:hypothetical protein
MTTKGPPFRRLVKRRTSMKAGEFDQKRRRTKRRWFNWAKRLMNPLSVQLAVALLVGITKVVAALHKLISEFWK